MADTDSLDDLPRQRLCDLLAQYGPSLCDDPPHFEALLRDLCGEHRREVFALSAALKSGIVAEVQKALEGGKGAPLLTRLARRMHEMTTIAEDVCHWAVESWAQALRDAPAPRTEEAPAAPVRPVATLPPPSPEHRRIAAAQFDRANQVINAGQFDYGIQLLLTCCKLDPANLIYRQALRRTEKAKFKDNLKGSRFAALTMGPAKARLKALKHAGDYVKVLEVGEELLSRNPWDTGTQIDMAEAAEALGQTDLAIWILLQARQKDPKDPSVNRPLAQLYEKRGNFTQAIQLWDLVSQADPRDIEARQKTKDLAAHQTIARGEYDTVVTDERKPGGSDRKKTPPAGTPLPNPSVARMQREAAPLQARIDADPTNAGLYQQLASVYRRHGEPDKALEVLRRGLAASGQDFQLQLEVAELELEPLRRDLTIAEERLRADPQNEELRRIRIGLLREINSRELEIYRHKADRFPNEMGHRVELGMRLLRAGQTDEAIRELQTARADARIQWRALLYLGYCFKAKNNWRLAQRNFEEALKALPATEETSRKELLFQLAFGAAEAGDLTTAIDLGHELANLDFGYRDIGRLIEEWQARLQQV
jgi:tetratricopeptide (TPR) repeat protein